MENFRCEECGQIISDRVGVCPNCGAPLNKMREQQIVSDYAERNRHKAMAAIDTIYVYFKVCYYLGLSFLGLLSLVYLFYGQGGMFALFLLMFILAAILGKGILKFIECILAFFKVIVEMANDVYCIRTKINS